MRPDPPVRIADHDYSSQYLMYVHLNILKFQIQFSQFKDYSEKTKTVHTAEIGFSSNNLPLPLAP